MWNRKAIIYIDMDATLNYHKKGLIERIPKDQRDEEKITHLRDTRYFQNFFNTPNKENSLYKVYSQPDFWLELQPAEDALETLEYIKNRFQGQVELRVATALPWISTTPEEIKNNRKEIKRYHNMVKKAKKLWLKKHFKGIFKKVYFVHDKSTLDGFCLIDDLQHSLKDFPFKDFSTQLWIQMGLEKNRDGNPDLYVKDWKELKSKITEFFTSQSFSIYFEKYQQLYRYVTEEGISWIRNKNVQKALKTLKAGKGKPKRLW